MALPVTTWDLLVDAGTPGAQLERASAVELPGICWALTADGDLEIPIRYLSGREAVAQGVRTRLGILLGELFWNLDYGVPYFEQILGQRFSEPKVAAVFRKAIRATPGVSKIEKLNAAFASGTRLLTVRWIVSTIYGGIAGTTEAN